MPDAETKSEPKKIDPKALSREYHKAHKQLMLWAAILFIWEFVGIDLDKAKDAEGYAGALVKSIKSPQAVPWMLLLLVFYFQFKCSSEWAQCHPVRRKMRFARADFISAWILSLAAIALYIGQAITRVQVADLVSGGSWNLGFFGGMLLPVAIWGLWRRYVRKLRSRFAFAISVVFAVIASALLFVPMLFGKAMGRSLHWAPFLTGIVLGSISGLIAVTEPWRFLIKRFFKSKEPSVSLPEKPSTK